MRDVENFIEALLSAMKVRAFVDGHEFYLQSMLDQYHVLESNANFGWVTRDGTLLGCMYAGHQQLLDMLMIGSSEIVENAGWMHVSFKNVKDRAVVRSTRCPSEMQLDWIETNEIPNSGLRLNFEDYKNVPCPLGLGSESQNKKIAAQTAAVQKIINREGVTRWSPTWR